MLTRALAYKGPTDHLSQFFELSTLYQGMQVLLDDLLMDWRYHKEDNLVKAVFVYHNKLVQTQLSWPMSLQHSYDECSCQIAITAPANRAINSGKQCVHLTALAIESKSQLDRLPQPLKTAEGFQTEWHYLTDWLARQTFDPFPNMARHRVIYLLDSDDSMTNFQVSLHKAYLTQQNEYQKKASLPLDILSKTKLPKFVSLTDQQIIDQMARLSAQQPGLLLAENTLAMASAECRDLLKSMVASGRCFWRSCYRHPLVNSYAVNADAEWSVVIEQLYLDKAAGQLIDLQCDREKAAGGFFGADLSQWQACLQVSSEQVSLASPQRTFEFDVAKISFKNSDYQITLGQLLNYCALRTRSNNIELLEAIAAKIHQLDWLPSVRSRFELPITQHLDICDRLLEGEFVHWLPLLRGLQQEGWQVSFDKQFRLNQKSVERWYSRISTVASSNQTLPNQQDFESSGWFDLEVGIQVDGQSINIMPYIVKALRLGLWDLTSLASADKPEFLSVTLKDGTRVQLQTSRVQKILTNLIELSEKKPLADNDKLRLPSVQFLRLDKLQKQFDEAIDWQQATWLKAKAESLAAGKGIVKVAVPQNIDATLRDYQQDGLNWLQFLARENLSGILADDMGLGKTIQTLAHIQFEKNSGRMQGPCMVVAPTSLLGNWLAEAERFTPQLKTIYWAGSNRGTIQHQLPQADLIITSYGLLLRDAELLNQQPIHLLILDEAQAIKNARNKITRIAFTLRSKHRLCLTGTPLENHLGELWSLFHFLMPGFLGEEAQFKRLFQIPIEKHQDSERQQELAQRVAPFMLRRTKDQVADDLPAKTVIEELIELQDAQADIYETVRLSMLEQVQQAIAVKGGGNQLLISNALLRLRQICCHPRLVAHIHPLEAQHAPAPAEEKASQTSDPQNSKVFTGQFKQAELFDEVELEIVEDVYSEAELEKSAAGDIGTSADNLADVALNDNGSLDNSFKQDIESNAYSIATAGSAKLTWLKATLPEMLENGRKVLIFSSFTSMLDIIAETLEKMSIKFLLLNGKSRNRTALVEQFQKGTIPIFLISLKAGGAGLNLTQADTVIHFDPWWNPAAENQASDRAHRIGQDKPVFVYKLISKGTVEQRINQMQQKKSQLADDLYRNNQLASQRQGPDWKKLLAPLGDPD